MRLHHALLALVLSAPVPSIAFAGWTFDGSSVCTAQADQNLPVAVSDGAGGVIVAWYDNRAGNLDVYAQRLDRFGKPLWAPNGVPVAALAGTQHNPQVVSDGAGGAIVVWTDYRGAPQLLYAQRLNAAGIPQWTTNGVPVRPGGGTAMHSPGTIADGFGGAIVTWHEGTLKVYAQKINASGTAQWFLGVMVCPLGGQQMNPSIAPDGAGGAYIVFEDTRGGVPAIYSQHVFSNGGLWTSLGEPVCNTGQPVWQARVIFEGQSGAIVTWIHFQSGVGESVRAQRLSATLTPQWATNGVFVSATANDGWFEPNLVTDGAGGAIVAWRNYGSFSSDIYAQRVDAAGTRHWSATGVVVRGDLVDQQRIAMVSDGAGGAIITWDRGNGTLWDVYAQRMGALGSPLWTPTGIVVSGATENQVSPCIAASDMGGAIVVWNDSRRITEYDIYAQRLEANFGTWGHPEPGLHAVADIPADQGGRVRVSWFASDHDALPLQEITHYSVWRAVEAVPASARATADAPRQVKLADVDPDFNERAVRVESTPAGDYFWEFLANQNAYYFSGYSYSAATSHDSIAGHDAIHTFQVVAHTSSQFVAYPSGPLSGYSVDNLAPEAPLMLMAQRAGSDVLLKWNRAVAPDLRDYSIYRATATGVTPVPLNFISNSEDTLAVDAGAPNSPLYYIVTARDVHANQSAPSNEASVGATTGIGNTPSITQLTVLDNMPNPFTSATTLRVGLPKASDVEISVFDVAGRRVRSDRTTQLAAGWRELAFNGRDDRGQALASGVYFYRIKAAGQTITRKMVIAR